jgi:hypothetical protein
MPEKKRLEVRWFYPTSGKIAHQLISVLSSNVKNSFLHQIRKQNESSSETSKGKFIYEVEAPDWDDEDPDDDLEI